MNKKEEEKSFESEMRFLCKPLLFFIALLFTYLLPVILCNSELLVTEG